MIVRTDRRRTTIAVGAVFGVVGAALLAGPAAAHDTSASVRACGPGGLITCGSGGVKNLHTEVYACDSYADGYGLRVYFRRSDGQSSSVSDPNGSSSGCGDVIVTSRATPVVSYQVCSDRPGIDFCTGWLTA
jgi:hypothetical protein